MLCILFVGLSHVLVVFTLPSMSSTALSWVKELPIRDSSLTLGGSPSTSEASVTRSVRCFDRGAVECVKYNRTGKGPRKEHNMANTTNTTPKAIVRFNKAQGGVEVVIPRELKVLSAAEREELKQEIGFQWHRTQHYWYFLYSDEAYEALKQSFLKDILKFPSEKEEAKAIPGLREKADQKRLERDAKKQKKQAAKKQAPVFDEEMMMAMFTKFMQMYEQGK